MTAAPQYRAPRADIPLEAADPDATAEFPAIRLEDLEAAALASGIELVGNLSTDTRGEALADAGSGPTGPAARPRPAVAAGSPELPSAEHRSDHAEARLGDAGTTGSEAQERAEGHGDEPGSAPPANPAHTADADGAAAVAPHGTSEDHSELDAAPRPTGATARAVERELALGEAPQPDARLVTALRSQLRETEARAATYFEALSSREWRRGIWEALWRDLDAEIDASRAAAAEFERKSAASAAEVAALKDALAARDAAIRALRAAAAEETAALRTEIERAAARDREQRAQYEAALSSAENAAGRQTARVIELESTFASAATALQAQLERAEHASARVTEHESRAKDFARRLRHLERELEAARVSAAAANAAARDAIAELAAQQERRAPADRPRTADRG